MKIVFVLLIINLCDGARILGIFNHPAASHTFLGKVLLKNLAKRGHEVVMVSSFPLEENIPNYQDIYVQELADDMKRREMMFFRENRINELVDARNMSLDHTDLIFKNHQVQNLINSNQDFDLVLLDFFFNEALLIFGHIFKAPVIYVSSSGNNVLTIDLTGNSLPFSYVPGGVVYMHDEMSFKDRLFKTVVNLIFFSVTSSRHDEQFQILKRHFDEPPSIDDLKDNVALVLSNSHFSFETARPYTPNLIPVGGFHVQEESEELPIDLKEFLDSAQAGVVYFSLGSQIKSSNLQKDNLKHIISAFEEIPQKVLWKYESEDLVNVPSNVKIVKWLPQVEVLAHSNVKLFITHGGLLSLIEGIHFAKPFLCIPFNGDQHMNAAFVESRQLGHYIYFDKINAVNFKELLISITNNHKFQENMNFYSALLRDQPVAPMTKAIFWIEHVIKHKGAPHLKPFSLRLPWYKYYLVDVIAALSICLMVISITTYIILKFAVRKCCLTNQSVT